LSIEGGIRGYQQRRVCPNCGKVFFAWRPDDLPGQKIKCYFCRHEFADEAAMRKPPEPAASPTAAAPAPAPPAATAQSEPSS
jgi:ribosomal protein S27AE